MGKDINTGVLVLEVFLCFVSPVLVSVLVIEVPRSRSTV